MILRRAKRAGLDGLDRAEEIAGPGPACREMETAAAAAGAPTCAVVGARTPSGMLPMKPGRLSRRQLAATVAGAQGPPSFAARPFGSASALPLHVPRAEAETGGTAPGRLPGSGAEVMGGWLLIGSWSAGRPLARGRGCCDAGARGADGVARCRIRALCTVCMHSVYACMYAI